MSPSQPPQGSRRRLSRRMDIRRLRCSNIVNPQFFSSYNLLTKMSGFRLVSQPQVCDASFRRIITTDILPGSLTEMMGDLDRAMTAYESALRQNPYSIPAMNSISSILKRPWRRYERSPNSESFPEETITKQFRQQPTRIRS